MADTTLSAFLPHDVDKVQVAVAVTESGPSRPLFRYLAHVMTREAEFVGGLGELGVRPTGIGSAQEGHVRPTVGKVAGATRLSHRCVNIVYSVQKANILTVTVEAEFVFWMAQQVFVLRFVRRVAGEAVALLDRFVRRMGCLLLVATAAEIDKVISDQIAVGSAAVRAVALEALRLDVRCVARGLDRKRGMAEGAQILPGPSEPETMVSWRPVGLMTDLAGADRHRAVNPTGLLELGVTAIAQTTLLIDGDSGCRFRKC
jgi:hypothetical protein